jgi:predicted DNA-binding transcriptional regulator AlpA
VETYSFTLIVDRAIDDATADALYDAGLDDAGIGGFGGQPSVDVDREASSLLTAIVSAVCQVESVGGIKVVRVEGEELVSQADIAERTGRTRQAVNHWIKRDRDTSGFPDPAYGTGTRSPLWRWSDVAAWLDPDAQDHDRDRVVGLVNATLVTRQFVHDTGEVQAIESLLAAS